MQEQVQDTWTQKVENGGDSWAPILNHIIYWTNNNNKTINP